jgi:hypothetical protein
VHSSDEEAAFLEYRMSIYIYILLKACASRTSCTNQGMHRTTIMQRYSDRMVQGNQCLGKYPEPDTVPYSMNTYVRRAGTTNTVSESNACAAAGREWAAGGASYRFTARPLDSNRNQLTLITPFINMVSTTQCLPTCVRHAWP